MTYRSPQDVYARHLVSGRGYPLWTPEPDMSLPQVYVREGLKIGDVGVVVPEDGSFDVFFNVCLPPTHILHRETGVPNNFTPIPLGERDISKLPDAEYAGRIISTSSVAKVRGTDPSDEDPSRCAQPGPLNYEFSFPSQEGAVLILPEGADRYHLRNERVFLDEAIQHAVDWYTFAEQRLGRIINHDSLYLITGFYKARSWSLAAYRQSQGAGTREGAMAQFKAVQVGRGNIAASYTWETTQAIDSRVGPSDQYYHGIPNQTMFIRGFKIAVREGILGTKWVNVKADLPSVRPPRVNFSSGSWFLNLSGSSGGSTANTSKANIAIGNNLATDRDDHAREDVAIHRFPQVTKPFHPSDIINQHLLRQIPSATVAITHDSQWTTLIERGLLSCGEISQEDHLIASVRSNYSACVRDGAAYLQSPVTEIDIDHNAMAIPMVSKMPLGPSYRTAESSRELISPVPGSAGDRALKLHGTAAKPNPTVAGSMKKVVGISQGPYTSGRVPAVGGGPIAVKSSNVWRNAGKKPSLRVASDFLPISREDTPVLFAVPPKDSFSTVNIMPKRMPTPPPADDEPRYLTVVYPYAINGTCNMELPKDREDFARWVACCIDKDAFFAMFHKPSSRAMVILEVNRDYVHLDRILGEHRWSEFLQKPTKEEMGRVTQVFYCTYSTGRIVQKNGWKRIDVDEAWFKAWSPKNRHIRFPYPATHFCDVPVEGRTNLSMCRPLPGALKTSPPKVIAPLPAVGSAAWVQSKKEGSSPAAVMTQRELNPLGAWRRGAPKPQAISVNRVSVGGWYSAGASTSNPGSDSGPDLTTATESDNLSAIRTHFSESMEKEFRGIRIREMDDGDDELEELDSMVPLSTWDEPTSTAVWEIPKEAYWDDDVLDAENLWRQGQGVPKPVLCKAHGIICKKSICAEYAEQLRNAKRAEELEKRKTAAANRGRKWTSGGHSKGCGAGKKNDDKDASETNITRHNNNNNPFWGPGVPVKTNWRGAPRAIVTTDTMATQEAPKAISEGGWGDSDSEADAKATSGEPIDIANAVPDTAPDTSWGTPENVFDTATRVGGGKQPVGRKKPAQANPEPPRRADQADTEFAVAAASGKDADQFTHVSSKRGSKRGKSSTTNRGSVADMPR